MDSNITDDDVSPLSWEGAKSIWELSSDDDIELYTIADDDEPYDIAGIPVFGLLILTVVVSTLICLAIIYCSIRQERTGSCCKSIKQKQEISDEECESLQSRLADDVETGLTLMRWDTMGELKQDENTEASGFESSGFESSGFESDEVRNDESSKGNTCAFQFTDASIAGLNINTTKNWQDSAAAYIAQRPRCVLCSKHFIDSDIVSESSDPTCRHFYHELCIVSWLRKSNGCPVCKKTYMGVCMPAKVDIAPEESATSDMGSLVKTDEDTCDKAGENNDCALEQDSSVEAATVNELDNKDMMDRAIDDLMHDAETAGSNGLLATPIGESESIINTDSSNDAVLPQESTDDSTVEIPNTKDEAEEVAEISNDEEEVADLVEVPIDENKNGKEEEETPVQIVQILRTCWSGCEV